MQIKRKNYVLFGFVCFYAIHMCTFALKRFARKNQRIIGLQPSVCSSERTVRRDGSRSTASSSTATSWRAERRAYVDMLRRNSEATGVLDRTRRHRSVTSLTSMAVF